MKKQDVDLVPSYAIIIGGHEDFFRDHAISMLSHSKRDQGLAAS